MFMTEKLATFERTDGQPAVQFVRTTPVCEGVSCDEYKFTDDESCDLGIITVRPGHRTPRQKVLQGDATIEGYLSGSATLWVTKEDGTAMCFSFDGLSGNPNPDNEVLVDVGDTMQWIAADDSELVFYEICFPPYQEGRFENLPE